MIEPLPLLAPETPDCTTVQLKLVPGTELPMAIEGAVPEQMVCDTGVAVTSGIG